MHYKDQILDKLAEQLNVAQFISFAPQTLEQRFSRVYGFPANAQFNSTQEAIKALIQASPDKSINVRSFLPDQPKGNEFIYGLKDATEALDHLERLSAAGFYTIINETVDVNDGGISGVLRGGNIEFAPGVIPRFVDADSEDPVPSIPKAIAIKILETVYGFKIKLNYDTQERVEFSLHPAKRGWRNDHIITWETETVEDRQYDSYYTWPNAFSRFIGDKAYGLLISYLIGLPTPRTTVFPRNKQLGIFTFGTATGSGEKWTRTCPNVQVPGKYSTIRNWIDPYLMMTQDDPEGQTIPSCIVQEGVNPSYSGAAYTSADNQPVIEGVKGAGDDFMQGNDGPSALPKNIYDDILRLYKKITGKIGPVKFEWVHDETMAWVVQLHVGKTISSGRMIYPGEPNDYLPFETSFGLDYLRELTVKAKQKGYGIKVLGNVGMTSHVAEILINAKVPSILD